MLVRGYRMPLPPGVMCPPALYEIIVSTWEFAAEKRPTFAFLNEALNDFEVNTEMQYDDAENAVD